MTSSDAPPSGTPPDKGRRRSGPTIDLEATEIENRPVVASPPPVGSAEEATAASAQDFQSEATMHADEQSKPAGPSAAPPRQSYDWRATLTGFRARTQGMTARLPAMPWRLIGAAGAGALVVLIGFLIIAPPPRSDDNARVLDMRLVRVEQQIRELIERAPSATTDPKIVEELASRLAKIETAVAAIRPSTGDPEVANRIATIEGNVKAMGETVALLGRRNDDIATLAGEARRRTDANAAAIAELEKKFAGLGSSPVVRGEFDALAGRLATIERSQKSIEAELAKRPLDAPPDRAGRLALLAAALMAAVERGEPFAAELARVKAFAPDAKLLAPLEPFAGAGVPTVGALARELSLLTPALYQAAGVSSRENGSFLERLQANAEKLVRIRPVEEVPGNDPSTIIARIDVKAAHNDVAGALGELAKLPATVRAPADAWIKRAEGRTAAVEASRQFTAETLVALGK